MARSRVSPAPPIALTIRRYARTALAQKLRDALFLHARDPGRDAVRVPLYWGLSTRVRTRLETFTIAGCGISWDSFTPTLDHPVDQLQVPETGMPWSTRP